ncbi:hypothetical protein V6Z11_A03G233000 [Gossypium hirsutum]
MTLTSYFIQTSHKACKTNPCEERLKCVLQATKTPHLNPTCCVLSRCHVKVRKLFKLQQISMKASSAHGTVRLPLR